jgi:hypothetical protein
MSHHVGIDPEKLQIIRACLDQYFHDVRPGDYNERFVYNDGRQRA